MFIQSIQKVSRDGETVVIQAVVIEAVEQSMPSTRGEAISMSTETAMKLSSQLSLQRSGSSGPPNPPKGEHPTEFG